MGWGVPPARSLRVSFDEDAETVLQKFRAELAFWRQPLAPTVGNWSFHGEVLGRRVRVGCRWSSYPADLTRLTGVVDPVSAGGSELVGELGRAKAVRRLHWPVLFLLWTWMLALVALFVTWLLATWRGTPDWLAHHWLQPVAVSWPAAVVQLGFNLWRSRRLRRAYQAHGTPDQVLRTLLAAIADPDRSPGVIHVSPKARSDASP
jgi:hypothetical protein